MRNEIRTVAEGIESVLYDGGGTGNALQELTTAAGLVAGGGAVIQNDSSLSIDIQLVCAASGKSCTLVVAQFSSATPTVANMTRIVESSVNNAGEGADLTCTVDVQMVGLSTATGYAKNPVIIDVVPGNWIMIALSDDGSSTWYARYALKPEG